MTDRPTTGRRVVGAARALGRAALIGVDRLVASPVPYSPAEAADAGWLSSVFAQRVPGAGVEHLEILDRTDGTTARVLLRIGWNPAGRRGGLPEELFVKAAPTVPLNRVFTTLMALGRVEVDFYSRLRPHLAVRAPHAHVAVAGRAGRFVLALDDLAAGGATFTTAEHQCTVDDARTVMTNLAALHAPAWGRTPGTTPGAAWVRPTGFSPTWLLEQPMLRRTRQTIEHRHPDLPDATRRLNHLLSTRPDDLARLWRVGPTTVIHGDAHIGNMYFDATGAGLLDWQVVRWSHGMQDVTYFLVNSVPVSLRRDHQEDLIRHYLDELSARGVDLPFGQAWEAYRRHVADAWNAAVVTAAVGGMQSAAIAGTALRRSATAIDDLDPAGAIEAALG